MYLCIGSIDFASFYNLGIGFRSCSDSVLFLVFHFITKIHNVVNTFFTKRFIFNIVNGKSSCSSIPESMRP